MKCPNCNVNLVMQTEAVSKLTTVQIAVVFGLTVVNSTKLSNALCLNKRKELLKIIIKRKIITIEKMITVIKRRKDFWVICLTFNSNSFKHLLQIM